jgi:hypothetical protein
MQIKTVLAQLSLMQLLLTTVILEIYKCRTSTERKVKQTAENFYVICEALDSR